MTKYDFDLCVIGGGAAGFTAAKLAAGLGKKVVMIDKDRLGGECTWRGCVPSKALLMSAKIAHLINDNKKYGIDLKQKSAPDCGRVMDSTRAIVQNVYSGHPPALFEGLGIKVLENTGGRFLDEHTFGTDGGKITSGKFIIAAGSSPFVPPIEGLNKVKYFTNSTIFSIKKLPSSMIILGGGPIGVELASAFNRLGVKVAIVEMFPSILFREDRELTDILTKKLADEGIHIITGAKVVRIDSGRKITAVYDAGGSEKCVKGDIILAAVGRIPNTGGLGLENIGVDFDNKGIKVDKYLRTSVRNIYAAGDVAGPYQFSHMANYQAVLAASNALLPFKRKADYSHVPWCTFTDPELARSGLTEEDARKKYGNSVRVYRCPYSDIDRAKTDRTEHGLAKIICSRDWRILGIHILGERACELMQEAHLAKTLGIPLNKLDSVTRTYPGYSDVIKQVARQAYIDKIRGNMFVRLIGWVRKLL